MGIFNHLDSGLRRNDTIFSNELSGIIEKATILVVDDTPDTHFDTDIFDAFVEIQEESRTIARRFVDSDMDMNKKKDCLIQAGAV